jgi:hypothetical protein
VNLIAVHRLLIRVFIVAALLFGFLMLKRWHAGEATGSLAGGIIACVLAVGGAIYLFKAPHLRGK